MKTTLASQVLLALSTGLALVTPSSAVDTVAATAATTLTKANAASGSAPYRETVIRYFDRLGVKIVGGKPARIADYPWQVSLGVSWIADPYQAHFCGGSVYSAGWIITAAHCVSQTAAKDIVITAGTDKLGQDGERRNVRRVIVNPSYDGQSQDSDVALLELMAPLPLGPAIQPISLMTAAEEANWSWQAQPLSTVGWGATREGGQPVRDLRFVPVGLVDRGSCNGALAYDGKITENMVCAGNSEGGQDSCQGDSGGPLSASLAGKAKLLGVVSWGYGCARPGLVGVYTRVPRFAAWADACVAQSSSCQ